MRRLARHKLAPKGGEPCNPLFRVYETVSFAKVFWNTAILFFARWVPNLRAKNWLYRTLLGVRIGRNTAIAYYVMLDNLHPELISIGNNCVIGYHSTILAHEYLVAEYRFGKVVIEDEVLIGACSLILPGVTIGRGAVIGAGSVVTSDIPAGVFAAGVPARVIRDPQ